MAGGRPCKYETHVKPYFDDIQAWLRFMTEEQVADTLGIAHSTWIDYKKKFPELLKVIEKGRKPLVADLKSTLIQRANGFHYNESKKVYEGGVLVKEEVYTKYAMPDVASTNLLLKNYDKENWSNDPQALEIKRQELELKKKQVDAQVW